jgi:cell division protease FtsH
VNKFKTAAVWIVLVVAVVFLVRQQSSHSEEKMPFSRLLADLDNEQVAAVEIDGYDITVTDSQGYRYATTGVVDPTLLEKISEQAVPVTYGSAGLSSWLVFLVPVVLLLAFLVYFVRKSRANTGNILSLRKSLHREISASESRVTFNEVGDARKPKRRWEMSSTFSRRHNAGSRPAFDCRAAYCWRDRRGAARLCWRERLPVRPMQSSFSFPDQSSSRCLWALEQRGFGIFSKQPSKRHLQ